MKRKCVICGTTDFGKMLRYYFEKYADVQIVAYTVDKAYLESDSYDGLPAVAYEEVEKAYPPTEYTMVIALGYKKMNQIRQQKFEDAKRKGYRIENFVHPSVVDESVAMGEGNIILEHVTLAYGTKIGNSNIIWNGSQISHESQVGDYNFFSVDSVIAGKTVVKNNCFLGINSTVLGNRTLEYATLVGAGAFVKEKSHIVSMFRHAVSVWKIKKVQRWLIRDKEKGVHRSDFNTLENLICEMIEWIFHL